MIIGLKDTVKLFGISIIACCAVFVCTLFLNYNMDLVSIENEITTEVGTVMYNAQVSMGKVTVILAFITLFLSLSSVVKGNAKTIAMMRVFGYEDNVCSRAILGSYRPISYIGFAMGTVYQYVLLKLVMTFVFADVENKQTLHLAVFCPWYMRGVDPPNN